MNKYVPYLIGYIQPIEFYCNHGKAIIIPAVAEIGVMSFLFHDLEFEHQMLC